MSFLDGLRRSPNVQVTTGDAVASSTSKQPPVATYRSTVDGTVHSVAITSPSESLDSSAMAVVRASFERDFGKAATTHAFRLIQGSSQSGKVTGKEIIDANRSALEFVAPGLRLAGDKLRAEDKLTVARDQLSAAEQRFTTAEVELTRLRGDHAELGDQGTWSPHLASALTRANEDVTLVGQSLADKKAIVAQCEEALEQATAAVDGFASALDTTLQQGDDLTRLTGRVSKLTDERDAALLSLETARAAHGKCQMRFNAELADKYRDQTFSFESNDLKAARRDLEVAGDMLSSRRERLVDLTTKLDTAQGQLDALRLGPDSRKLQVALDLVGADERFTACLDQITPGKVTGGALGTIEGGLARLAPTQMLPSLVRLAVAPVGIGSLFYQAVKAEDCERHLTAASKGMDDHPVAKSLGMSLAASKETEKWKLGIEATIGFVSFALSAPGGSAMGALTQPATSLIQQGVTGGVNTAVGSILGGLHGTALSGLEPIASRLVSGQIASAPTLVGSKIGSKVGQTRIEKLGNVGAAQLTADQQREMLKSFQGVPGMSVPTIPVRPFGPEQAAPNQLSLGDPDVLVAFLSYLGPKADHGRLNDSDRREGELRRLDIRSNFFGARDADDFSVGVSSKGGQRLIEALDGGVNAPTIPAGTSPLQLLMVGAGLIK